MILSSKINIAEKRIKTVKAWPELKSVRYIQVFWQFADFSWRFIQNFIQIAVPFILTLKTTTLTTSAGTQLEDTNNSSFLTPDSKLTLI